MRMPPFKKALLTGGNGNLGRLVAERLVAAGVEVIKFDLPGSEPDTPDPGETVVAGDLRDHGQLEALFLDHRPDAVYHFASLLSGSSETDLQAAWDTNAGGSFQLMRLALDHDVKMLFFASTAATYGSHAGDPLAENAEQWPETLYGATKVAVERLGVYFKMKHGLDFRCLRFPLVVSPNAPKTALTAYPSHACKAAVANEVFTFPVAPEVGMSSIFLEDVVDGIVQFTRTDRERLTRHIYNLHAYFFSAQMIADKIRERFPGFDCRYEPVPAVNTLLSGWPDIIDDHSARADWQWAPRYDFEKSLTRMFELLDR